MTLTTIIQEAWNFVVANKAILIGALAFVPSVITALSPYPKAKGIISFLQFVLNLVSILTHRDSPNTLKMLGTVSQPPVGAVDTSPSIGAGTGAAVVVGMLLFGGGACTFLKGIEKPSETCGINAILGVFAKLSEAGVVEDIGEGVTCEVAAIAAYEQAQLAAKNAAAADAGTAVASAGPTTALMMGAMHDSNTSIDDAKILDLANQYLAKHK